MMLWLSLLLLFIVILGCLLFYITKQLPELSLLHCSYYDPSLCHSLGPTLDLARASSDFIADAALDALSRPDLVFPSTMPVFQKLQALGDECATIVDQLSLKDLPSWIDLRQAERGRQFLEKHLDIAMGSGTAAIIESYGYTIGAKTLILTGRLCSMDARQRLIETGQFYVDCVEYGLKDARAIETVARVRLLHARLRRFLVHKRDWQSDALGPPACDEDMLHTICLFSHAYIRGMQGLGLPIEPRQCDDISMFWSCVGYMLGIPSHLLPRSYEAERKLHFVLEKRLLKPDENCFALTRSTMRALDGLPPEKLSYAQWNSLIHLMLGDKMAQALGLPPASKAFGKVMRYLVYAKFWLRNTMPWISPPAKIKVRSDMNALLRGKPASFSLKVVNCPGSRE